MSTWDSMTLRQQAAYFLVLSEVAIARKLLQTKEVALAREALTLGWAGWNLQNVDYMRFDTLAVNEYDRDLFDALSSSEDTAEEAAWGCVMDMLGYIGYYFTQSRGISPVPQSIENVRAVDVRAEFDSYFDQVVQLAGRVRSQVITVIANTSQDQLTQGFLMDLVSQSVSSPES